MSTTVKKEVISWVKTILLAAVLAGLVNSFLIVNAEVPTGSMENTIMAGDRILALRTSYWFDEPEAGIDLWSFQNLIQVFERMRKNNNGSILIISHQERILNIADEIVVIADGKIVKQGTREEIMPEIMGTAAAVGVCSGFTGNDGKEDQE